MQYEQQERPMVALLKMPTRLAPAARGDADAHTPIRLERRVFPRKEIHARVEGRRLDHALCVYKRPTVSLAIRDLSAGGLSAISDTPLLPGERVTVFFPPQGIKRGWDAYGRIIRCEPSALGYRVAIEFDVLPAA
jgi:hypothetical protein